ncbi:MAG: gamma-glutamylcyclotransferase [Sulfurimonas sp.]|uniref:gamma-glutamylcyclotransferase family protein n=1 Tax=Sulfurimonas sp. TaxID=2022749 RepID=UPI002607DA19|nr:gamma-glutamylcyclotransferase family protein [Sulfurimonas sp.]MDD5373121.1 gamma-glutamylcyclotransferase [Sulfurimonas sp.]
MTKSEQIKKFIKKLPLHEDFTFKYVRENLPDFSTDIIRVNLHRLHDNGTITIKDKGTFSREDEYFEVYLFVYGTLKKGFENEHFLNKAKYISKASTVRKFAMYTAKGGEYPYLLKDKPLHNIEGELYKIARRDLLKKIDLFEGSPDYYTRESIEVKSRSFDTNKRAFTYFYVNKKEHKKKEPITEWKKPKLFDMDAYHKLIMDRDI